MKRRRKGLEIFSMSALDLFAAAMGAFVLIAVIALPYYKKEIPDLLSKISVLSEELTQKDAQIAAQTAEIEQQKKEIAQQTAEIAAQELQIAQQSARIEELDAGLKMAEARARKLQEEVADVEKSPKYQLPNIDVVIVLDTTASMGDVIDSLKQELGNLAAVLGQIAPSAAIGIIGFNDRLQTPAEYVIFPLQEVAAGDGSLRAITRALQPIEAGAANRGSNDLPENLYGGLRLAVKQPWRSNSESQVIVIVTDALPHADTKRAVLAAARDFAADKKKTITAVNVGNKNAVPDYREVKQFMEEFARVGQGRYAETRSSLIAPILLSILAGT